MIRLAKTLATVVVAASSSLDQAGTTVEAQKLGTFEFSANVAFTSDYV